MPTITTSLHHGYQPNLDVLWACREIGSNAIDGEERHRYLDLGEMSISYSKRSRTLVIRNDGITVPATALLMGTSDSREEEACIGQFGEGLPMALLVLARNGVPVTIYNGSEKWEPAIERVAAYGNERVLVVKTRKMPKDRGGFEVHIKSVDPDEYDELRSLFLRLDNRFDEAETVNAVTGERLLLQPQYHGKIYNKGVFVMEKEGLAFGYDLRGELNRDRSLMDEWTLQERLGSMLDKAVRQNESVSEAIVESLFDPACYEGQHRYSDLAFNYRIKERVAERFVSRYGDGALPVESEEEVQEAKTFGRKGIVCPPLLCRIAGSMLGTLEQVRQERKRSIKASYADPELGTIERENLRVAEAIVKAAYPGSRGFEIVAADFADDSVKHLRAAATGGATELDVLYVPRGGLLDLPQTLLNISEGCCEANSDWDESPRIMAKAVAHLLSGTGSYELAMHLIALEK